MANSDKNILITPNKSASGLPEIALTGFGASTISIVADDSTTGKVNFVSAGTTVFSVDTNIDSGKLFDVSDINQVPIIEVTNTNLNVGAKYGKVIFEGDGITLPSYGTTSLPSTSIEGTLVYDDNHKTAKVFNGSIWVPIGGKKSGLTADTAAESTEQLLADYPDSATGFYWLLVDGIPYPFWVDTVYDGGGYILVLNNRAGNGGMPINYQSATTRVVNSRGNYASFSGANPGSFNLWVGLDAWVKLANANFSTTNRVVEFVSGSWATAGAAHAHSKRASWSWTGWSGTYAWQGAGNFALEAGSNNPGLWSYHIANGYSLTSFDVDQDVYSSNCATLYGNSPWWFGACWDGFMFPNGGGYSDVINWSGAGSDTYSYGALYVR